MNKTKYNQLRKAIISAVPSIMRFGFGCEMIIKNPHAINDVMLGNDNTTYTRAKKCCSALGFGSKSEVPVHIRGSVYRVDIIKEKDIYKIIGRDILLEDCLIAIDKIQPQHYMICTDGEIGEPTPEGVLRSGIFWKPNTPLHQQEQETKDLLWDLICKDR